ncbi:MAG: NAD(P)-binding domain-containing protein, partial [Alphaproteobacteria bacterium]|nr:NAD(P)-binding domain-containing protein [Alphaproteobacteria bacterium]
MLDQNAPSVLLAGCGKMGGSLMRRWLSDNRFSDIYVLEPHSLPAEFANAPNIKAFQNVADVMAANVAPDIVILAVKPQIMLELC